MQDPLIPIPKLLQSDIVYKGYFEVREDLLEIESCQKKIYSVLLTAAEAVAVLAVTKKGELVLNKEYRHPTQKWLYGCPGGTIDEGESPIEAAQRELLEETGYVGTGFEILGSAYPYPAHSAQKIHYVLITGVKQTQETTHEPFELIQVEVKPLSDLRKEIQEGAYIDGILLSALYFKDQHKKFQEESSLPTF